jgi:hypothetical protein
MDLPELMILISLTVEVLDSNKKLVMGSRFDIKKLSNLIESKAQSRKFDKDIDILWENIKITYEKFEYLHKDSHLNWFISEFIEKNRKEINDDEKERYLLKNRGENPNRKI